VWSSAPAAVAFTLRPYFWQTRPFLAVAGLALAALAFGAHRVRVRAVARSMREEMLRELSLHDELTGLHNRRGLMALAEQHVRSMARTQRGFAIVFIDMDGMKHINDTLGHAEGDRALVDVAALLRLTFRESDIAARIGGDEFAVLVRDDGERPKEGPDAASARLRNAVQQHNATAGRPYQLSLSIGHCRCDPASPVPLEAVMEEADQMMFAAKRRTGAGR
jgi:diguanylate cyclase (GGDEF)-like protein